MPKAPPSPAWRASMGATARASPASNAGSPFAFPKIESAAPASGLNAGGKKKDFRVSSRSELQAEVMREFETSDISKLIKRVGE